MNTPTAVPSHTELLETFTHIKNSTYRGVAGVYCIDSGIPGPILGITACTHGNEPSGLAVIHHIMEAVGKGSCLHMGKLLLVLNNIEATEKYLNAQSETEERLARFIDVNMNRLPENALTLDNDTRSEIRRAKELRPVWEEFTHGLDIHSTLTEMPAMIISRSDGLPDRLLQGIPIETVLLNIENVQIGKPAFAFYGAPGAVTDVFAIEAGSHKEPSSFVCAIETTMTVLQNLAMIDGTTQKSVRIYKEYFIQGSILFPDMSFRIPSPGEVRDFELVPKGTVLGTSSDGHDPILAPFDTHPIMMSNPVNTGSLLEEAMFLSLPVTERTT